MRRFAAVVASMTTLLAGCGLPDRTDPKNVGPAAAPTRAQNTVQNPPDAENAAGISDLIDRFLRTSVGGNVTNVDQPDAVTQTQTRMRTFLTEAERIRWRPGPTLTVVKAGTPDVKEGGAGVKQATVWVEPIGVLDSYGRFVRIDKAPELAVFKSEQVGSKTLLSEVPHGMLISVEGFNEWYVKQPIYFWELGVEQPKLVPDLRYMPKTMTPASRVSEVVSWLQAGASDWMNSVVDKVPGDFVTKARPTIDGDGVTVNLTAKAANIDDAKLRRFVSQLRWSLPGSSAGSRLPVKLAIEDREREISSEDYKSDNAATIGSAESDQKYCVVGGVVRPVEISTVAGPPPLFQPGGQNTGVVSATIKRDGSVAALVKLAQGGSQRLWVSVATGGAAPVGERYVEVPNFGATRLSRPVWINRPAPRFLISDGAKLFAVAPPAAGAAPEAVPVDGVTSGRITAFAVAPDGRRIALIIDNKVVVATLTFTDKLSIGGIQKPVATRLEENLTVGWYTETELIVGGKPLPAVAGSPAPYALLSTTVDGVEDTPLPRQNTSVTTNMRITQLSVRTGDPTGGPTPLVMFEENNVGQILFNNTAEPVAKYLAPAVTPSAGAALPGPGAQAVAPFYGE